MNYQKLRKMEWIFLLNQKKEKGVLSRFWLQLCDCGRIYQGVADRTEKL